LASFNLSPQHFFQVNSSRYVLDIMNRIFYFILIVCLGLFSYITDIRADDRTSESKNELVVYFKSATFEIDQRSFNNLFKKLDPNNYYLIKGYSCSRDKRSKDYLLAEAERRAEIVRKYLIKKGFPANKLTTTVYDHGIECKAILVSLD